MIEAWGRGTIKIVDECKKAGLPEPEFREEFGGLSVFFRKAELGESGEKKVVDKVGDKVVDKVGDKVGERLGERLGETEKKILALIAGDKFNCYTGDGRKTRHQHNGGGEESKKT